MSDKKQIEELEKSEVLHEIIADMFNKINEIIRTINDLSTKTENE